MEYRTKVVQPQRLRLDLEESSVTSRRQVEATDASR